MKQYDVKEYVAPDGKKPYGTWLKGLKDGRAKAKLLARADKAAYGNFGDWKPIKGVKGLFEMREHYGPGYRIYYAIIHGEIVLLLAGSTKANQEKMIAIAAERLADYERRS
jgi:putative addiction module killer protein